MEQNLESFKKGIQEFREKVKDIGNVATASAAYFIFKEIAAHSPDPKSENSFNSESEFSVGRFTASTRIGVGKQDPSISSFSPNVEIEHNKQIEKLKQITNLQTVYITNSIEHAKFVEYEGWHGQEGTWEFSNHPPYAPFRKGFNIGSNRIKNELHLITKTEAPKTSIPISDLPF